MSVNWRTKRAKVEQRRIVRGAGLRARGGEHGVGAGEILGAQVLRRNKMENGEKREIFKYHN